MSKALKKDEAEDVHGSPVLEHDEEYVPEDDAIIGTVFRRSLVVIAVLVALVLGGIYLANRPEELAPEQEIEQAAPEVVDQGAATVAEVSFANITQEAGIDFVHVNGSTGEKLLPETMGGGVAFFDYDNDGDADLLFINSNHWPHNNVSDKPTMALYRNDGGSKFSNVTREAGFDFSLYGMGVAIADYDADGDQDVFVSAVGPNKMLRNDGGVFKDVTAQTGLAGADQEWSNSSGFFDYDNDGDLDLFVCNYVRWSKEIDFELDFRLTGVGRAFGPPQNYQGTFAYLYRNEGDGNFTDVSAEAGIRVTNPATDLPMAKALALAPVDVDQDGFIDILVANDTVQNFFFHNQGDGTFEEAGEVYGFAYDRNGNATGAMGMDSAYYRNDHNLGFMIGNFANEMSSVYVAQDDPSFFVDEAIGEGIGAPTRLMLTFGLFLFDYDLDGRLDVLQANGHIEDEIQKVDPSQFYRQPAQLFWNGGDEGFIPVDVEKTGDLAKEIVGRGAAYADIDLDGDLDVVLTQVAGPPLLLRNEQQLGHHWLRVKLAQDGGNPDAIGAWIELTAGGVTQRRQVMPTRSYISQVELPVTFGLGSESAVESLKVIWPDGSEQTVDVAGVDQQMTVERNV